MEDVYKRQGKRSELAIQMKERVDKEYEAGRNTVMSDGELVAMLREIEPETYERLMNARRKKK